MHKCYVCDQDVNIEVDMSCNKQFDDGTKYRHAWHGVPGITHTASSAGIQGYAKTLGEAKRRAEYYLQNEYAAPEVKAAESEILKEVERLQALESQA
jgi:hypothetical protein